MFCEKCGAQLDQNAQFCTSCGAQVQSKPTAHEIANGPKVVASNSNVRLYNILSYLGILWIIGLVCDRKNDESVRFHCGQGMILSICTAIFGIIIGIFNGLIISKIFVKEVTIFGIPTGVKEVNGIGLFLMAVLIFYMVMVIMHAYKGEQKPLPVIGKFAFYR